MKYFCISQMLIGGNFNFLNLNLLACNSFELIKEPSLRMKFNSLENKFMQYKMFSKLNERECFSPPHSLYKMKMML